MGEFDKQADILIRLQWLIKIRPFGIDLTAMQDSLSEITRLRAALAVAERRIDEFADRGTLQHTRAERAEADLAEAREVISGIVKRWDSEEDRDGNERYSGMAMYEDMEPEMKKARAFLERTALAPKRHTCHAT